MFERVLQEVAAALRERRKVEEALEQERLRQEKLAQSRELQEAEDIIKAAQEELAVITEMVQVKQAGRKLAEMEKCQTNHEAKETSGVQVDLDQMFSFLSEVQQTPLDEKLITDVANEAAADEAKTPKPADEAEAEKPAENAAAPPQHSAKTDGPIQNGFSPTETSEAKPVKLGEVVDEKDRPASAGETATAETPSKPPPLIEEVNEKLTPQTVPRTASPIKPEDTDSECNGEDDEEVR